MPGNVPESGRSYPVARPLLFIGWALVLWGTLVVCALAWRSLQIGPGAALGQLVSGSSSAPVTMGWINLGCAVLAVAVWSTLAVLLLRRDGDASPE